MSPSGNVLSQKLRHGGLAREETGGQGSRQVEDAVANGDPAPRPVAAGAEDPQRQVLDREVRMAVGRGDEAPAPRFVSMIDQSRCPAYRWFGLKCFFSLWP